MERKGPFGLWMGMSIEEVNFENTEIAFAKYQADSVPVPHSAFESYVMQITPRFGLSWVKAIGKTIQTSAYGFEVTAAFDAMEERLSTVYGGGERTDVLLPESIWNEPRDRMMAFLNHERFLMTEWSPEHGSSLKESLASVALIASALDANSGYINVEYSFQNYSAANAEIDAAEDEAL